MTKDDFSITINNLMRQKETVKIAMDNIGTIVAFDEFIEPYKAIYEEVGMYSIHTIQNNNASYQELLEMSADEVQKRLEKP